MKKTKYLGRARLNTILSAVYDYPLTILEAPMGYGKTTAVKKFIESEKLTPFWFTFLESGNPETAFWNKFTDEIIKMDSQAGFALKSLGLSAGAPQIDTILQILSNVTFEEKFLMVLDDYQYARDARLNKLILQLAQEELDGLHILLVTRDTSGIDFVELLSKGLCGILSRHHLKFTEPEIQDYCRMMVDGISDTDLRKICEYTDGWISLIYLLLLGLESEIPVGMSTIIEEMIEKSLFTPYDRPMQDFLLKLSFMEEFTAAQSEYVTGNENAKQLLKKLHRNNSFIFYDEKNKTYKIHSVLLDYLRMKRNFSAEEACEYYSRLGDWHLEKEEFQTAYGYLNQADQRARILSHLNNPHNYRNELIKFTGADEMFDSTPKDVLFQYPFAYLLHILYSIIQNKKNAILGWTERLDELQQHYEKLEGIDENYRNRILGETMLIRKFTLFNHITQIKSLDKEIIRLLNGQNSYMAHRGYSYTFGSPQYIYIYFRDAGSFKELSDMLGGYVEFMEYTNGCGTGSDSLSLAEYALETGDFEKVERNCLNAIEKAETMTQIGIIICAKFSLIRLFIIIGRLPEALELLEQMNRDIGKINSWLYNTTLDLCRGYIFASICQPERVPSWLQIGDMTASNLYYQGLAYNYIVYGKSVMASKKYAKLDALTGQFKKHFSQYSNQLGLIHNKIFESVAKCNLAGTETGAAILEATLNEARADRLIMPFVESAPHIIGMMQRIVQSNAGDEYFNSILALCQKYVQIIQRQSYHAVSLSRREVDILSLAAEGLSRKGMAAKLCISEETVKTHFKNIYQKLGVSSKVTAIKLAQACGYLGTTDM